VLFGSHIIDPRSRTGKSCGAKPGSLQIAELATKKN
jgi:hypothetical protein